MRYLDEIPTQLPTWLESELLTQVLSLLPSLLLSPLTPACLNTSLDPLSWSPSAPAGDQSSLICLLSASIFPPICFDLPNLSTAPLLFGSNLLFMGALLDL